MDANEANVAAEVAKTLIKEGYRDMLKPSAKKIGELLALFPRAMWVMLGDLHLWLLQKEENLRKIGEAITEKTKDIPDDQLVPPEPYVAIPAIQSMSYCIDSDELRDMYANLLASSMCKIKKSGVMPAFVEIIKQLCPDEAKILQMLYNGEKGVDYKVPTIDVIYIDEKEKASTPIINNYALVAEDAKCESPDQWTIYVNNLTRLGLLTLSKTALMAESIYKSLENSPKIREAIVIPENRKKEGYTRVDIIRSYYKLTDFGKQFCRICVYNPSKCKRE